MTIQPFIFIRHVLSANINSHITQVRKKSYDNTVKCLNDNNDSVKSKKNNYENLTVNTRTFINITQYTYAQ